MKTNQLEDIVESNRNENNENRSPVPAQNEKSTVDLIDLTGDEYCYFPAWKKTLLSNGAIAEKEELPTLGATRKTAYRGCFLCGGSAHKLVLLECHHRLCYICFIKLLNRHEEPDNRCPDEICQRNVSDLTVKTALFPEDYVLFLEHSLKNSRTTIARLREELNRKDNKEEYEDSEKTIIINENEPTTSRTMPKRRFSELTRLTNLEKQSIILNKFVFDCPICFVTVGADGEYA